MTLVDSMVLAGYSVLLFDDLLSLVESCSYSLHTSSYNFERTGPRASEFSITFCRSCKKINFVFRGVLMTGS